MQNNLDEERSAIRHALHASDAEALTQLTNTCSLSGFTRRAVTARAVELVKHIRSESRPGMMELFLAEYGLSTEEGVALMCLAEALLRVPDSGTIDALIEDKIAPSDWGEHLGKSSSSLVNASTWALFVTGKVLNETASRPVAQTLHGVVKRLGEPVIRQAVLRVMKELGGQFVLGETIQSAMKRAAKKENDGFTYSYDMLGEAARTAADAQRYYDSYADAIRELEQASHSHDIRANPGISIKLSALHPRYELLKHARVIDELVPRARDLAALAKTAGIGLNIDAEEAGRLDLSLDVIERVLSDPQLEDWDGFGVVVQAYSKRAPFVLNWLYGLAKRLDRKIMVRLVKGAYWDTEIKHAQVEGLPDYPVFQSKPATDISYICCAKMLLGMTDRIYPQFATHNAHTVAAILELADDPNAYEFQRLHGMGEALHDAVHSQEKTRCRIYAPVGAHRDLLAYLVRRLLENGANSSFVNQIVDESVPVARVAADPFEQLESITAHSGSNVIALPEALFAPSRRNSKGYDLEDPFVIETLRTELDELSAKDWNLGSGTGSVVPVISPQDGKVIGSIGFLTSKETTAAIDQTKAWAEVDAKKRADILNKAADLYEENAFSLFSLLIREAGKTINDCVGELREAVDFLRYYASEAKKIDGQPAGIFACISPWNFPLAIFTGQISAALAVGNGVVAKPAESTSLIAEFAVGLLKEAGVPDNVLTLVPGTGEVVGSTITSHAKIDGICFTGSTATAKRIDQSMAQHLSPSAALIAETGGLNAMVVDSTALPEQAVGDIIASAFQSAGQRCSALRVLYLQEDIAENFKTMLFGAMDELEVGDPNGFSTDVGPVIDETAKMRIMAHVQKAETEGRLLKQIQTPDQGTFIGPTAIAVSGIDHLKEEIFGPVLHIATFKAEKLDSVVDAVNATGYGLTFGIHSRIDDRVQHIVSRVKAGNIYVNRNQIGAVVGSQPFGGEGLSGTGPKAGGPHYLYRFFKPENVCYQADQGSKSLSTTDIERAFDRLEQQTSTSPLTQSSLPGPTGESNRLNTYARGRVLCLGPTKEQAEKQSAIAKKLGCKALAVATGVEDGLDGTIDPDTLRKVSNLAAVVDWSGDAQAVRQALAERPGPIVPLLTMKQFERWLILERQICVDTTAAGGNTELMA
ncbi:MAG: bifunctional proline dehydrogenase/L-glutamate gamma-semialdehyde dehydrogenase PutA [Pelagimonas sp.]|uniref:bifunctional proline dehydrogenase/L-glutamate gamma-semialdehyde dehydrogenase PutA n=1 Tax=Pelagimonas sp. TaxID=2073170 RepID=UPI003D6BC9DC